MGYATCDHGSIAKMCNTTHFRLKFTPWNGRDIIDLDYYYSKYSLVWFVFIFGPIFPAIFTSASLLHCTYYIFFTVHVIRSRHYWNLIGLSLQKCLFCSFWEWQFSRLAFPHWSLIVGNCTCLLYCLKTLPIIINLEYISTL